MIFFFINPKPENNFAFGLETNQNFDYKSKPEIIVEK